MDETPEMPIISISGVLLSNLEAALHCNYSIIFT